MHRVLGNAVLPWLLSLVLPACSACPAAGRLSEASGAGRLDGSKNLYGVREGYVQANGVSIFVRSINAREPRRTAIVLHGGPGVSHEFELELLRSVPDDVRVVFFDQRGTGRSSVPRESDGKLAIDPGQWDLSAYVSDVEAVRRSLNVARIDIVGISWGSLPALAYASSFQERVTSLVLVSVPGLTVEARRREEDSVAQTIKALQKEGRISGQLPSDCIERLRAISPLYFTQKTRPESWFHVVCATAAATLSWDALGAHDFRKHLARVRCPTLVLQGQDDPMSSLATARQIVQTRTIPAPKESIVVPGCGHCVLAECSEATGRALRRFWRADERYSSIWQALSSDSLPKILAVDAQTFSRRAASARALDREFQRVEDVELLKGMLGD